MNWREIMSKTPSTGTGPELAVRRMIRAMGFAYRKNVRWMPGSPDVVLPGRRVAIFVNGCFWHGHRCPRYRLPATNTEFWQEKRRTNRARDAAAARRLRSTGWKVVVVWECEIKKNKALVAVRLERIIRGRIRVV